jgi:hypothetical protein
MSGPRPVGTVGSLWEKFTNPIESLIMGPREHRHQDQYLRPIQEAVALAKRSDTVKEIDDGYRKAVVQNNEPTPATDAINVVVMELEAFPLAFKVYEEQQKAGAAKPGAIKRLRVEAKTILGSVRDTFQLSEFGKSVVVVLIEALNLVDSD